MRGKSHKADLPFAEEGGLTLLRRLSICLAFATWCFADTWVEYAEEDVAYFARQGPFRAAVVPILILEVVLTLGMFAIWEFCRRKRLTRAPAIHFLFLAACFAPVGMVSVALLRAAPVGLTALVRMRFFWPAALVAGILPLGWVCLRPVRASRFMRGVLRYSWPVLILVLVQAVRGTLHFPDSAYADRQLAVPLHSSAGRTRVVWIIFDELSQTIAFGNRAADLQLPNLDRLKGESFYATAAESPSNATLVSLPSLILGEQVLGTSPQGPGDLRVRLSSRAGAVPWSSLRNVFDSARDLGFNTAVVGWYHPYGRVLNGSLTKCYWTAGWMAPGTEERFEPQSLLQGMWDRVEFQSADLPLIGRLPGVSPGMYARREKIAGWDYLSDHAREVVSDPGIGLALLHLPLPHFPAIYNRARGTFSTDKGPGYLDNVALVDLELGMLRHAMEESGLWDRSAILVSADHGWRTGSMGGARPRNPEDEAASHQDTSGVPFLLKLPGQTVGSVYSKRFNTVSTRRLITGILNGQVTDSAAVAAFIEDAQRR